MWLEWIYDDLYEHQKKYIAKTPFGEYAIYSVGDNDNLSFDLYNLDSIKILNYNDLETVKNHAENDYYNRVKQIVSQYDKKTNIILPFDEWCELYEEEISTQFANSGRDREHCFDIERDAEKLYEKYVLKKESNK